MKKPAYPVLAQLMAKHGVSREDISKIIGLTYRNALRKLNRSATEQGKVSLFDIVEAGKITKHFQDIGENITMEDIFFTQVLTNASKPA